MRFEYDVMTTLSREKVLGDGYTVSETGELTIWAYDEYVVPRPVIAFSARCWCSIKQKDAPS